MKQTNKSISEFANPCFAAAISKRNRNASDIVNGTSAVISVPEPAGKFCPFDR